MTPEQWREAARLGSRLGANEAFGAGLRLLPAGRRLATELGLPPVTSVEWRLRAAGSPAPGALVLEWTARTPGMRRKATILAGALFPPRDYLASWAGRELVDAADVVGAYASRVLYAIHCAPGALRAWTRAKRGGL